VVEPLTPHFSSLSTPTDILTMSTTESIGTTYLTETIKRFHGLKDLADRAAAQVSEADRFATLHEDDNSIAIIMKHLAGNMRSRWTDFLTSDGEKPDRHRDTEFELYEEDDAEALAARWEAGWQVLFDALDPLTEDDLLRTITIRGEPHTVLAAIQRQLAHYAYHVGQIVMLARHFAGDGWESLTIPKGQSETFNASMRYKPKF
jgi:uncharacterized damage-inducible protein DinB